MIKSRSSTKLAYSNEESHFHTAAGPGPHLPLMLRWQVEIAERMPAPPPRSNCGIRVGRRRPAAGPGPDHDSDSLRATHLKSGPGPTPGPGLNLAFSEAASDSVTLRRRPSRPSQYLPETSRPAGGPGGDPSRTVTASGILTTWQKRVHTWYLHVSDIPVRC